MKRFLYELSESWKIAVAQMRSNKTRSTLTALGVTLAASRDAATRPGELAKARRLADDAYWVEFESSDMETAVNKYLGFGRARGLDPSSVDLILTSAEVHALSNKPEEAIADLKKGLKQGLTPRSIESDPELEPLRNRADYQALMNQAAPKTK